MRYKHHGVAGHYSRFLPCLGVACPLVLSPMLFLQSQESRCCFCLATVSILQLTETLPPPVVALLPLFVFADFEATPSTSIEVTPSMDFFASCRKITCDTMCLSWGGNHCGILMLGMAKVLVVLVDVMMVRVLGSTSVLQRLSLLLLEEFGARLRNVAFVCMSAALIVPLVVHDTLAVLLVLALVRRLVFDFMNDNVQSLMAIRDEDVPTNEAHTWARQHSDDDSSGADVIEEPTTRQPGIETLAALPVPTLNAVSAKEGDAAVQIAAAADVLRPAEDFTYATCSLPAPAVALPAITDPAGAAPTPTPLPAGPSRTSAQAVDDAAPSLVLPQHICFGRQVTDSEGPSEKELQGSRAQPRKGSLVSIISNKSAKKGSKQTSIVEGGKVVLPGDSSPTPKPVVSHMDSISGFHSASRRLMKESVGWKFQKLCTIHEQLATAAVLTCTLASSISLNRNRASMFFTDYFRARFNAEVTNALVWTAMLLPMEYVSILLAWMQIRAYALHLFDAEVSKSAAASIRHYLRSKRHGMGRIGPVECLRLLLFTFWIALLAFADVPVAVQTSVDELHPVGMLCLVLAYSVPWRHHGHLGDISGLARNLPWGVIITVAGSGAISLVVKESGFGPWLRTHLQHGSSSQIIKQAVLAVSASMITELVSNASALSLLLPVAVDVAVATPCNPLYLAIPVAVAASTSIVLPTSGVGIAVLCNMIDVGPVQLLLNGLTVKFTALVMILVTVNLNSDLHRLPDWMFNENENYTAAFAY